jgi:hypothetical protein
MAWQQRGVSVFHGALMAHLLANIGQKWQSIAAIDTTYLAELIVVICCSYLFLAVS